MRPGNNFSLVGGESARWPFEELNMFSPKAPTRIEFWRLGSWSSVFVQAKKGFSSLKETKISSNVCLTHAFIMEVFFSSLTGTFVIFTCLRA